MFLLYLCGMMKLLRYLMIRRTMNDPLLAAKIYQMIYHPEIPQVFNHPETKYHDDTQIVYQATTASDKTASIGRSFSKSSEKEEALKALHELKNKQKKTVADKTSINMLEAIIPNLQ